LDGGGLRGLGRLGAASELTHADRQRDGEYGASEEERHEAPLLLRRLWRLLWQRGGGRLRHLSRFAAGRGDEPRLRRGARRRGGGLRRVRRRARRRRGHRGDGLEERLGLVEAERTRGLCFVGLDDEIRRQILDRCARERRREERRRHRRGRQVQQIV